MENHLVQIRRQLALKQVDLADVLDCSPENISMIERGKSSLSERNKKAIIKKFNLNPVWFDDPTQKMFASPAQLSMPTDEQLRPVPQSVPMYDADRVESLAALFDHNKKNNAKKRAGRSLRKVEKFAPLGYIHIPGMADCDGAIRVSGEAMVTSIGSGDMVIYSQLRRPAGDFAGEIFWGETYLVEVETSAGSYIAVRRIRRSPRDGMAILSATNPDFADTEIPLTNILALAIVKMTVRRHF